MKALMKRIRGASGRERSEENCSDVRNKKLMNTARLSRRYNAFLIDYLTRSDGPVT